MAYTPRLKIDNQSLGKEIQKLAADYNSRVAAFQADSEAVDTAAMVVDFNALLAKLQAAGLMAEE